jgi:hypothetical protein
MSAEQSGENTLGACSRFVFDITAKAAYFFIKDGSLGGQE